MSTVFYSFFNLFLSFHYAIIYGSFAWYHPPFNLPFIKHTSHSFQRQAPLFWREKEKLLVCFQQFLDNIKRRRRDLNPRAANIKRRRRDLNPRAATNDLLPFQGSPFGQLGYFSTKRRGWDSNPRALSDKRFSRPPRYDHFDTSPSLTV